MRGLDWWLARGVRRIGALSPELRAESVMIAATLAEVLSLGYTILAFTRNDLGIVGGFLWPAWLVTWIVMARWARPTVVVGCAGSMSVVLLAASIGSPGYGIVTEPFLIVWTVGLKAAALVLLFCWPVWVTIEWARDRAITWRSNVAWSAVVIVTNATSLAWWPRPLWFVGYH